MVIYTILNFYPVGGELVLQEEEFYKYFNCYLDGRAVHKDGPVFEATREVYQ